jgi:hypothetical protein
MKRIITISIVWIALHCTVKASPVVYTLSGTGTGSLGGVPFSDVAFSITSTADTANIAEGLVFEVPDITATVFVSGLGTATFTIPTQTFDNHFTGIVGINAPNQVIDIFDISNPAFSSYDLSSSLGPVAGTASASPIAFETTVGDFSFSSVSSAAFQADVVPEPSIFAFLCVALIGLALREGAKAKDHAA